MGLRITSSTSGADFRRRWQIFVVRPRVTPASRDVLHLRRGRSMSTSRLPKSAEVQGGIPTLFTFAQCSRSAWKACVWPLARVRYSKSKVLGAPTCFYRRVLEACRRSFSCTKYLRVPFRGPGNHLPISAAMSAKAAERRQQEVRRR